MSEPNEEPQTARDAAAVGRFLKTLDPILHLAVCGIRDIILAAGPAVGERIKWNHPAFYYTGPLPPFDAKTYAREIAVFNLHRGRIMLVFTHGAGLADPGGLLEGDFTDGRRTITFRHRADVDSKADALRAIIQDWIRQRAQA